MEFIDLTAQQKRIRERIEIKISAVLDHGKYIMGPEIGRLESELKEFAGISHAIACASGTDAILLALLAQQVGPGDAIFTSPFTFIASAEVISLLGATPVYIDIDAQTYNIKPENLELAIHALLDENRHIYPLPFTGHLPISKLNPKGIIAVDLFGLPADYDRINSIAQKHNLFVLEDAAQSFGAEYNGKKACSFADIACTSFFPAKPLGCYGDGGMCFTDDDKLAEIMRSLRIHGKGRHKYDNIRIGINGRMDTIQAAILIAKFEIFSEEVELRQAVAANYSDLLSPASSELTCPLVPAGFKSVWAQFSILAKDQSQRSRLQKKLQENDIPTAIYYSKPLHLQTAFSKLGYRQGDFPVSEDCSERIFSIPMHPYLTKAEQEKITRVILNGL
jgi:UDP-2-acetamido-2-deoxy-ribo-hexuluronate aminotransferase